MMYYLQESKFKLVAYWCKNEIADNILKKNNIDFFKKMEIEQLLIVNLVIL